MNDELAELLRRADSVVPALSNAGRLAHSVRNRCRRRKRRAAAAGVLMMVALASAAAIFRFTHEPSRPTVALAPPPDPERARPEALSQLRAEALLRDQIASQLVAMRHRANDVRRAGMASSIESDPIRELDAQRNRAALLLVARADRARNNVRTAAEAADDYRLAAELFPATAWGTIARSRLAQMAPASGAKEN